MVGSDSGNIRVGLLEPFYGGSHRAFAEGWQKHSRHTIEIEGLPARFWKWRMRGAAFEMARRIREKNLRPDLWFAGSLMDVAQLRSLLPDRDVPIVTYFHESQAAYPWRADGEPEERDLQYVFTDFASAAASDAVAFNSSHLRDGFITQTRKFLARMPDARPMWLLDEIEAKSVVLPLGVEFSHIDAARAESDRRAEEEGAPTVLWCHRWEYDKNPEEFFAVLFRLAEKNVPFRVIVAGAGYERIPDIFQQAKAVLGERIVHWGGVEDRDAYARLLCRAAVVVSTAFHETFGIGMVEAAYAGAHPLAPRRLSYPEVFPPEIHGACLYADEKDLEERLASHLTGRAALLERGALAELFVRYSWLRRVSSFDDLAARISSMGKAML